MAELNDALVDELEQLAPIGDAQAAQPDWSQVTRRLPGTPAPVARQPLRPHRLVVTACALLAGAAVAVAAIAASGNWLWKNGPAGPQGTTQFQFHGSTYSLGLMVTKASASAFPGVPGPIQVFSLVLTRAERTGVPWFAVATANGSTTGQLPGQPSGPPFGAMSYASGGGQIVFGDGEPRISTIAITDTRGHVFRVRTVAPPKVWKLPIKLWVVTLPDSSGKLIAGFDTQGRLVTRVSLPAVTSGHGMLFPIDASR